MHCHNSTSCLISSIFLTHDSYSHCSLNLVINAFSSELSEAWFRINDKWSRERCRRWTALHAQCTGAMSSGFPISQGNAEVLYRWGGKTNHCLISYFLSNISAKNYRNRIVYVKIIASQMWDVFEAQCTLCPEKKKIPNSRRHLSTNLNQFPNLFHPYTQQ